VFIVPVLVWPLLIAVAIEAGRRRIDGTTPRCAPVVPLPVLLLLAFAPKGHLDERALRGEMASVAEDWIRGTGRRLQERWDHMPAPPPRDLLQGPPGILVIGAPESPGFAPVIGPTVTAYLVPPNTTQIWTGATFPTRADALADPFLEDYPFEVWFLESVEGREPPAWKHALAPLTGRLPQAAAVAATPGSPYTSWSVSLDDVPYREVAALALEFDARLPPGTSVRVRHGDSTTRETKLTLDIPWPTGQPLLCPLERLGDLALEEDVTTLEVVVGVPDSGTAPAPTVRLLPALPALRCPAPRIGARLRPSDGFPRIEVADVPAAMSGLSLRTHTDLPWAHELNLVLSVPEEALTLQRDGVLSVDAHDVFGISLEAWRELLATVSRRAPNVEGVWYWIQVECVVGLPRPGWAQARSPVIPVKLAW
jgi:hypothetical protein